MNKKKLIISIVVLFIDQITKSMIQAYNTNIDILDNLFGLHYYQNTGAAWSILEGKQTILILITIGVLVLVYNMMFSFEEDRLNNFAFGLLFGGILGNLIDRVFYGFVRDFIDIVIVGYDFPVFNIADMAIVIGIFLVIVSTLKGELKNGIDSRRKRAKNR